MFMSRRRHSRVVLNGINMFDLFLNVRTLHMADWCWWKLVLGFSLVWGAFPGTPAIPSVYASSNLNALTSLYAPTYSVRWNAPLHYHSSTPIIYWMQIVTISFFLCILLFFIKFNFWLSNHIKVKCIHNEMNEQMILVYTKNLFKKKQLHFTFNITSG